VQWGSGNENDSYVSQATTTISSYSCHNVCGKPPKNLNLIYQAKVSLLMQCMDLGFRVQGLELGALDLRHKKSSQFQALYI
jgi:hypothetical protein